MYFQWLAGGWKVQARSWRNTTLIIIQKIRTMSDVISNLKIIQYRGGGLPTTCMQQRIGWKSPLGPGAEWVWRLQS